MLYSNLIHRRRFLTATAATSLLWLGCEKSSTQTQPGNENVRRDVPLRVLLAGNNRWADVMKTAWSGIAEQALQVNVLDPQSIAADKWQAEILRAMNVCDVAIVTTGLVAAIEEANQMIPLNETLLGETQLNATTFLPVLREGAMKFGGRTIGTPLGAVQPSIIMRNDAQSRLGDPPQTWDDYLKLIQSQPNAAEPLAGGAAAQMYLWRANTSGPPIWLFDRETFAPVIDTQPYVDVLEMMKRCTDLYGNERLTAGEVWSRVVSGKLQVALSWPASHSETDRIEEAEDCQFAPLPMQRDNRNSPAQTLVAHDSPIAVISSHCRQSDAAQRFIQWLADGEGTSMIRDVVTGLTKVRGVSSSESSVGERASENGALDRYDTVLSKSLSSLSIRTPLQLLEYRQYAAALDDAVLSCLDGKQTAQEALSDASKAWSGLTQKVGIKTQARAWRKAQGLSS